MKEYDKVQIYLSDGRVLMGEFNIVGEPRLTDALNDSHPFIALRNATDHRGEKLNFIIINTAHIVSVQLI